MAALASTLMAVSVTVLAPNPSAAPTAQHAFMASPAATLGQTVQQWSQENGLAAPQIDKAVASLSIGKLTVTGGTVCEAVGRLVSALKYADTHPEMTSCGSDGAVISAR
jgi:hypothetical protein